MAPTVRSCKCHHTHQEYSVDFFGDELIVTQTDTPSVIRRWIHSVLFNHRRSSSHPLVVGVGVQWTPNGYSSDSSSYDGDHSPADTLQLCVGHRCIIIQLTHCNRVPQVLHRFLEDSNTTFVGIWNSQDARKLAECRHQLEIFELLDVRKYVTDSEGRSLSRCSFGQIVEECLGFEGVKLDPKISMSDWSVDYLGLDQIVQASVDAYVCFDLGVSFRLWEV